MRTSVFGFLALLASGCGPAGPKLYPVTGSVTVNGQPAALVRVQFRHADPSLPGNAKMPAGMTDDRGVFHLSTSGDKDGVPPSEYAVTFAWMSANELTAFDKLGGKFADPQATAFKVTIGPRATTLDRFALTLPESAVVTRPSRER